MPAGAAATSPAGSTAPRSQVERSMPHNTNADRQSRRHSSDKAFKPATTQSSGSTHQDEHSQASSADRASLQHNGANTVTGGVEVSHRSSTSNSHNPYHRRHSSYSRPPSQEPRPRQRTPSPRKRRGTESRSGSSNILQSSITPALPMPSQASQPEPTPDPDFNSGYPYGRQQESPRVQPLAQPGALARGSVAATSAGQADTQTTSPQSRRYNTGTSQTSNGTQESASSPTRRRRSRDRSKKVMLANALRMANSAVILDNDEDFAGAVEAYDEACRLLGDVMASITSDEERRKLTEIQDTYSRRVQELQNMNSGNLEGLQDTGIDGIRASLDGAYDMDEAAVIETATATHIMDPDHNHTSVEAPQQHHQHHQHHQPSQPRAGAPVQMPLPLAPNRVGQEEGVSAAPQALNATQFSQANAWRDGANDSAHSSQNHSISSMDGVVRKHIRQATNSTEAEFDAALDAAVEAAYDDGLEPYQIDQLEGQHARLSTRLSMIKNPYQSDQDEQLLAERQAKIQAMRAKIEARRQDLYGHKDTPADVDSDEDERLLDHSPPAPPQPPYPPANKLPSTFLENAQVPAPHVGMAPRGSDSSGFSGRTGTWGSSVASSLTTAGTALSPVDETSLEGSHRKQKSLPVQPPAPPPTGALPTVPQPGGYKGSGLRLEDVAPPQPPYAPNLALAPPSPTIRERRASGNKSNALKIDTPPNERWQPLEQAPPLKPVPRDPTEPLEPPKTAPSSVNRENLRENLRADNGKSPFPSPLPGASFPQDPMPGDQSVTGASPTTPALPSAFSFESTSQSTSPPQYHRGAPTLQRNGSTLSLNQKLSPGAENQNDISPATPMAFAFTNQLSAGSGRIAPMNTPAHPQTFRQELPPVDNRSRLFDHDIHSPTIPGSPNPEVRNAPKPLEPCPQSSSLRPFWLMRCFYQTLAHPRGGYISTKLFIPRDVWQVKNVKLKGLEEKISNCDLLTAALLKLAAVDTYDADAILDEMQAFENVLDQVQSNLTKKLGNEVGVHTVSSLFKDAPDLSPANGERPDLGKHGSSDNLTKSGSSKDKASNSKGYMASWRKLRNKSSAAGLSSSFTLSKDAAPGRGADGNVLTMNSVPMTTATSTIIRGPHRHQSYPDAKAYGPNANYMGALTRLCDAVQILDQIARQVEDPGLRHSSPTHVGIELCTRHAAEFFGFYICRFIIQDVITLSDKYVKRSSEWVLT